MLQTVLLQIRKFVAAAIRYQKATVYLFVVLLLLFLGFQLLGDDGFSPWLFTTTGTIYIDSPEVYTRERLVNDRYDQDYWLRQQLQALDSATNWVRERGRRHVEMGLTSRESSRDANPAPAAEVKQDAKVSSADSSFVSHKGSEELPFDQMFQVKAAMRDTMRQLLLENMLDDRHDLTGNSIFGLKFDTTVIPGGNTRRRAYVRVSLTTDPFTVNKTTDVNLPAHVAAFFAKDFADIANDKGNALYKPWHLYLTWLQDIETRLNDYVLATCAVAQAEASSNILYRVKSALEDVLGMDQRNIKPPDNVYSESAKGPLNLENILEEHGEALLIIPEPWSRYLKILVRYTNVPTVVNTKGEKEIRDSSIDEQCPLLFSVDKVWDSIYIFQFDGEVPGLFPIDKTRSGYSIGVLNPYGKSLSQEKLRNIGPKYLINQELINYAKAEGRVDNDKRTGKKTSPQGAEEDVQIEVMILGVPSGFFNFIETIVKKDAYIYAIPKSDVVGILTRSSFLGEVSQGLPDGNNARDAYLNLVRGSQSSSTPSVVVGYGVGGDENKLRAVAATRDAEDRAGTVVEFGWVISGYGRMETVQKAQMALVSVPAWTSELGLEITTGWLDRDSKVQAPVSTMKMKVPVPPDFEMVDSLIVGNELQRKPKILDVFLDQIDLVACRKAEILIPGLRLWRSTVVTLGAQKASKITILPNMQGILADFGTIQIPSARDEDTSTGKRLYKVKLRVWTSEGIAVAPQQVVISVPENVSGNCQED